LNFVGKFDAKLPVDGAAAHFGAQAHVESVTAHATHAPSDAIIVPDAQLLFNGDFKRSGVDLILSKDHQELVLHDYFKGEKRAALSSPDGAHLTGDLVNALTGHVEYAQADGSASVGHVIGHVSKLTGTATAIRNGVSIILNNGDNVEKGDVVQSGSDSTLGITFIDGTVFGLSSNARMVLNEMVYDPNGSNNSSLLSLVAGTISFVAGESAKHGDMKVDTPVATMGIRGTAVLVEIDFQIPVPNLAPSAPPDPSAPPPPPTPPPAPTATFQVLVEPDGTTGSYILFDKTTLTPLWTVNVAGVVVAISQGTITTTTAALSADAQKIIADVFAQKFSDSSNSKTTTAQTDTVIPESGPLVKLASGQIVVPTLLVVNLADKPASSAGNGAIDSNQHIDIPPAVSTTNGAFVERAGVTGSTATDIVTGKVNFVDINAGDKPTVSMAKDPVSGNDLVTFTYADAHGVDVTAALNAQQRADIAAVEANLVVVQGPDNTNNGSATWTYSIPDGAFDFLAAGETLTLTYTAKVDANYAPLPEITFKTFTITITGTDDAPTIATTNGVLAEHTGIIDHAGGTITFADVDLTDRPVVSTTFSSFTYLDSHGNNISSTLTPAQQAAIEVNLKLTPSGSNTDNGSVGWSYDVADSNLGFLTDGQTLTLTYLATVNDGHGGITSTPLTVTIIGSGDPPHLITELPGQTGNTDPSHDNVAGSITFTGVDLSDITNVDPSLISVAWSGGDVLPGGLETTLESSLSASVTSSVGFSFHATDNNFDFLADGETLTVIYDVAITDSHGLISTRPVVIIVTGTNDLPTIDAATNPAAIAEVIGDSHAQDIPQVDGTITITDRDINDPLTLPSSAMRPPPTMAAPCRWKTRSTSWR